MVAITKMGEIKEKNYVPLHEMHNSPVKADALPDAAAINEEPAIVEEPVVATEQPEEGKEVIKEEANGK
jgi:hypothetical protein